MAKPFLKYAGGKTKLLPQLLPRMPTAYGRYYEPFLGGGALFFCIHPERAVVGDYNADLMNTYAEVARHPEGVVELVELLRLEHTEKHYNFVRSMWNYARGARAQSASNAAAMIYLNRTCFNGLWRVNARGEFNVPIGRYTNPLACAGDLIMEAAPVLRRAIMRTGNYFSTLVDVGPGDFAYLDPPYDGTFNAYTSERFDQAALAAEVERLVRVGAKVMISNSDTPRIRDLYSAHRIDTVRCPRAINSLASGRGEVNEVIVMAGYDPGVRSDL